MFTTVGALNLQILWKRQAGKITMMQIKDKFLLETNESFHVYDWKYLTCQALHEAFLWTV